MNEDREKSVSSPVERPAPIVIRPLDKKETTENCASGG